MPTKRKPAAHAAKPTTLNAAEEAGRRAHAEAVGDTERSMLADQPAAVAPPTRTRMELLHVETYKVFSKIEGKALRQELTGLIIAAIYGMELDTLQAVARSIDIIQNNRGFATPAEEFITCMVRSHYANGGLTPDMVAEEIDPDNVDGFHRNFKDLHHDRSRFDSIYGKRRPDANAQNEAA